MPSSADVRDSLVDALEAELVGPFFPPGYEGPTDEVLSLPPSRWYLTGFLAPHGGRETQDPTADDELGAGPEDEDEEPEAPEGEPKVPRHFPASMGMSVLLPPSEVADTLEVTVRFSEYVLEEREVEGKKRKARVWRRMPRQEKSLTLRVERSLVEQGVMVPDTPGVFVKGKLELAEAPGLPKGTRGLSLFVVNERVIEGKPPFDGQFLFQVELELHYAPGFVARPNRQGEDASDWDDRVADLQFRGRFEHAVGHGVSVEVPPHAGETVTRVKTKWLPRHEVRRAVTHEEEGIETAMEKLAALSDGAAAKAMLGSIVDRYEAWLVTQATIAVDSDERRQTRDELVKQAREAKARIAAGLDLLASDPQVFEAFRRMNEAMARSALQRSAKWYSETKRPKWRLFQLAFVLLNLVGVANDEHEDRKNVELIFFPTGGGKTEAYLGVIAFTLLLRRLRGQTRPDQGLGVAVLLRYTLRLLTLDQLGRAATLICALELQRQAAPEVLGDARLAVGLWVGRSATANTLEQVKKAILEYKNSASKNAPSPFPLPNCPWCDTPLTRDSLTLVPSPSQPEGVVVGCADFQCAFSARKNREGLPVLFVDEQIYRELPSFVVATVDKFAMMPWRGETGMLFGRATHRHEHRFYGPMDSKPRAARPLPDGLRPPELIVQDELHLISGPLGTMVGLYETAIEHLCARETESGERIVPKVIASTATVRRAREQIRALFGRQGVSLFPPPGVNDSESFFAKVDPTSPGRLYVGVAAQGRSMKGILLRTYVDLLCAAEKAHAPEPRTSDDAKKARRDAADPYMTVAGYFNSLRELGGMRRLVEDDVRVRCEKIEDKRPVDHEGPHPTLKKRKIQAEPVELTSRESTAKIKDAKDRLGKPHDDKEHVDVLLASNMISVGVDIDRLGLMVVAGQPKTTSEYIQASSRVGRQHPGLVVTCFNIVKPRDRSHYERFVAYHASFYRFVEATSLTPFSGPALERGLAGTLVGMTRLGVTGMTPAGAVMDIEVNRKLAEVAVEALAERAGRQNGLSAAEHERLVKEVRDRGLALVDAWETVVKVAREESASKRSYSRFDKDKSAGKPLLTLVTDEDKELTADEKRFVAPTSMRDVEESVHLWIERRALGGKG
ncbi:MAG: DISARM system helicase DrmA [Myxococcales bacterium]|nr:DISARM system helicase DrmA [Myxococcales bacterium]